VERDVMRLIRRWLARRRLPAIMRKGTPREGGRGALSSRDDLYASSGHLERTAANGCGLVVERPDMTVVIMTEAGPLRMTRQEWHLYQRGLLWPAASRGGAP
jgi:hypothetical protein